MMVTSTTGTKFTHTGAHEREGHANDTDRRTPIERASARRDEIRYIARRITRSESAAHDVTQDVFVRVLTRGGYDPSKGTLEVWLHTVAHNTAVDWVRRETAHQRRLAETGALHSATSQIVDETVTDRMQADDLRAAVKQLPEVERAVVELAYFGGLSYRQVAQQLDLAEGTVKSRIRRALTRLAHIVAPDAIAME